MSSRKIWFGNTQHAQWVPCPAPGLMRRRLRAAASLAYANGGGDEISTQAWRSVYELDFPVTDATEYEGIEAFSRFASGEYGDDYLRFVDPMFRELNLFSPVWAAPGLIEKGWPNFGEDDPTFGASSGAYGRPARQATWQVTSAVNAVWGTPFTFLVPPSHTLHLGASGTNPGGVALLRYLATGGSATTISLGNVASAPAFTATIDGSTSGKSVTVYLTRGSIATAAITLCSLWAQIRPTGQSAVISRHLPGEGHAGLRLAGGDPMPLNYLTARRHLVGMAGQRLVETEPWAQS
jgi:hypothetical protein